MSVKLYSPAVIFIIVMITSGLGMAAPAKIPESPSKNSEAETLKPKGLAELIPKASQLSEKLARLERELAALPAGDPIDSQLKSLETRMDALAVGLTELKQQEHRQYERLQKIQRSLAALNMEIVVLNEPLTARLRKIDSWRGDWQEELKYWQAWKSVVASADMNLLMVRTAFENALNVITTARKSINQRMERMMAAQKRAFDVQAKINAMRIELDALIAAARGEFLRDFSPPMYSPIYFTQFGGWLKYELRAGVAEVSLPKRNFFIRKSWVILFQIIMALALAFGIRKSEFILEGIDSLRFMRRGPYSVGVLISTVVCWSLYEPSPAIWQLLLAAIILTTTARLVGSIVANRRRAILVYLLVACLFVIRFLSMIQFPSPLFRIFIILAALSLGIVSMRFLLRPTEIERPRVFKGILIVIALTGAIVTITEIIGFSALALLIFRSTFGFYWYIHKTIYDERSWRLVKKAGGVTGLFAETP